MIILFFLNQNYPQKNHQFVKWRDTVIVRDSPTIFNVALPGTMEELEVETTDVTTGLDVEISLGNMPRMFSPSGSPYYWVVKNVVHMLSPLWKVCTKVSQALRALFPSWRRYSFLRCSNVPQQNESLFTWTEARVFCHRLQETLPVLSRRYFEDEIISTLKIYHELFFPVEAFYISLGITNRVSIFGHKFF